MKVSWKDLYLALLNVKAVYKKNKRFWDLCELTYQLSQK